jgi:DNA-binding GntR family transcriptional regulator
MSTRRIVSRALYEKVADALRARIYAWDLQPGDWIDERALCAEYGISRTPLREALKVLNAEGLVILHPRRGCRVRSLSPAELDEMFPVMAVLEGLCAREAIVNAGHRAVRRLERIHERLERFAANGDVDRYYEQNFRFHTEIQNLSGNRHLQRIASELRRMLVLARHHQLLAPGRMEHSIEEHRKLMDAIREQDADLAEARMKEHLRHARDALTLVQRDDTETATEGTQVAASSTR